MLVPSVPGILTKDSKTVIMLCQLLLDDGYIRRYFDPDLLPIPWNEQVRNQIANFCPNNIFLISIYQYKIDV